ncbi:hypothetical protein BO70DRAFT_363500 [Aspergillus heteromorphus CBS 117.55]|uniref:Uncharacterized protein n=1 Tax=Aspergillus heteromorphus CBS 117.55 TaxID=1448321 RepID=A0A317V0T9_9EURO|nr:uncharacterized protein BO70DRAFT_366475 [Aspergillus heteromorphus CBS 117.55]XP_025398122.1 uncharacterized protein BO70DRAFT_363500 [Aspergillus heteromorphus CBS 117.55]PWY66412.1 hypothetical protein BO70DRAFT_366475 [Aspergillus heteromorphus CBS 117.55]PWY77549.1 hypothetical protein BO70DRAFT_363500 [Aspergillus heteromorphus CBS 117.55]
MSSKAKSAGSRQSVAGIARYGRDRTNRLRGGSLGEPHPAQGPLRADWWGSDTVPGFVTVSAYTRRVITGQAG